MGGGLRYTPCMASLLYGAAPWLSCASYLALCFGLRRTRLARALGLLAVVAQGLTLLPEWFEAHSLHFGFAISLSWMLWLAMLLLWVEAWFERLPPLSALVYPIAALAVVLPIWFPGSALLIDPPPLFRAHILLAMLAYSAFFIAATQALLVLSHERALHQASAVRSVWSEMPPLLTMDRMLAHAVIVSFAFLTLTLVSGVWVTQQATGALLRPDHKTVFTLATWLMTAAFLFGRGRWGWRGRMAARFTLTGFVFLLLAYVGSRFVIEVILGR